MAVGHDLDGAEVRQHGATHAAEAADLSLGEPVDPVTLSPGERVLIVEDVVTRGGRVLECLEIVRKAGGTPVGVAMLVDRSAGQTRFDVPAVALLELSFPTYAADQLPPELAALPASKPGS